MIKKESQHVNHSIQFISLEMEKRSSDLLLLILLLISRDTLEWKRLLIFQ